MGQSKQHSLTLFKLFGLFALFALSSQFITAPSTAFALEDNLTIPYFKYEDRIYSLSKKTELGEQVEIDARLRYNYAPTTYADLRFETAPEENTQDSKTNKFELLTHHEQGPFTLQLDLDLKTGDKNAKGDSVGALTVAPDSDSEGTFLSYKALDFLSVNFFPYNFDGEVGDDFKTGDVTMLHHIVGASTAVFDNIAQVNESIDHKTIPGIVLTITPQIAIIKELSIGYGVASYLYAGNSDFDLLTNPQADFWERREDHGYRATLIVGNKDENSSHKFQGKIQFVGHNQSEQTGSLLKNALSIQAQSGFNLKNLPITIKAEATQTTAGKKPYDLNRSGSWFNNSSSTWSPYYSEYNTLNQQNWAGKTDRAFSLKVAVAAKENVSPYFVGKYQGKNFVFKERESAHLLRTAYETQSHGGLTRLGLGADMTQGKFSINTEFEWLKAKNAVFDNSSDVRDSKLYATHKKTDAVLSLKVIYIY